MPSIRNQTDWSGERDWNKVKVMQSSILRQALEIWPARALSEESDHPQLTGLRIDWLTGQGHLRRERPLPILQAAFYWVKLQPISWYLNPPGLCVFCWLASSIQSGDVLFKITPY